MPELPEVETIRRQLAPHLIGRTLLDVEILDPRWTRPEPPRAVEDDLRGRVVEEVGRSGKYLVWRLTGDRFLWRIGQNYVRLEPGVRQAHVVRVEM